MYDIICFDIILEDAAELGGEDAVIDIGRVQWRMILYCILETNWSDISFALISFDMYDIICFDIILEDAAELGGEDAVIDIGRVQWRMIKYDTNSPRSPRVIFGGDQPRLRDQIQKHKEPQTQLALLKCKQCTN